MRVNLDKLQARRAAQAQARDASRREERAQRGADLVRQTLRTAGARRGGVITSATGGSRPVAKARRERCQHLLDMARGGSCLLQCHPNCRGLDGTTVQCHENSLSAGKGLALKAHDYRSVRGCHACHTAYDQGAAPAAQKRRWFAQAMARQMEQWRAIAADPLANQKDRSAAAWAVAKNEENHHV